MKFEKVQKVGFALLLAMVTSVSNASIIRAYDGGTGSGLVTYTEIGNQLQIEFDNTTDGSLYSSIITGLVFDVVDDIDTINIASFVDGNGGDLSGSYSVSLDTNNNITPGNTIVDLAITTTNGINGGIFNAASPGNTNNAFPDIAVLLLDITSPNPWALSEISNDILRMQRTGLNENGSLKIDGMPVIPVPAAIWLFVSGLLCMVGVIRRNNHV